jgi:hypothetical protein
MISRYEVIIADFPVWSLEDGLAEDDSFMADLAVGTGSRSACPALYRPTDGACASRAHVITSLVSRTERSRQR